MQNTVELTGHYGGDITHALSAWTSTYRELTEEKKARIPKMLYDLVHNDSGNVHSTPFEKSYIQFLVRCDTASHIHMLKHRIGVSINAESARYKEFKDPSFYAPKDWDEMNSENLDIKSKYAEEDYHNTIKRLEESGMTRKRAKESARYFLPYAVQVNIDISFNFKSFIHFQKLRNEKHAQKEIREIAQEMLRQVKEIDGEPFKYSLEAFGY